MTQISENVFAFVLEKTLPKILRPICKMHFEQSFRGPFNRSPKCIAENF